jgi:hypothetical protein
MLNNTEQNQLERLEISNSRLLRSLMQKEELLKAYKKIEQLEKDRDVLEAELKNVIKHSTNALKQEQKYLNSLNSDDGPIITDVERVIIRYNPKKKYIRFYFKNSEGDVEINKIKADKMSLRALTDYISLYYKFEQGGVYDSEADDVLDNMDSDDDELEDLD